MSFADKWMDLENVILRVVTQKQKDSHDFFFLRQDTQCSSVVIELTL